MSDFDWSVDNLLVDLPRLCKNNDKEAVYRIGTEWCTMQCKDLLKHGVPAVHFYTMGKSRNITDILRECF